MKLRKLLFITKKEFRHIFKTELFRKVNLIFLTIFGLLVVLMWPRGLALTPVIPQRFDVGFTLFLLFGTVFITQYLTASKSIWSATTQYQFSKNDDVSSQELIIGQSMAITGILILLLIMLFPHGFMLFCCGYFTISALIFLYLISIMMVIAFVLMENVFTLMTESNIVTSIMRIIVSSIYVVGLIFTIDVTPAQIKLNLPFHLVFTGITVIIFLIVISNQKIN